MWTANVYTAAVKYRREVIMEKQATIRDVAKLAGVSLATVSRVLNGADYPVKAELRQKVKEAAEALEYIPNTMARSLRGDISRDIGLVIPNLSNQFYLQAMQGISDVMAQNSYNLILCNTMRNQEQERACLRNLYERQVRGVILSAVDERADIVSEFASKGMKFVLLDQKLTGIESAGINFDSRNGALMAMEHLIGLGHERIAFATLPMTCRTRIETYQGYCDALRLAGIEYDETFLYERSPEKTDPYADLDLETGCRIAEDFLRDGCPATAILCVNDMLAIGVIKTLMLSGVRVPQDVSVFGFDDIPFAEAFMPALTTVHYPAAESGRLAALMILDVLKNEKPEMSVSMQLTPSLVLRDTVCAPAKDV